MPTFVSILCSPHGGIATYVLGLLEAQFHNGQSSALIFNPAKSDRSFLSTVGDGTLLPRRNILNVATHKLPSFNTFLDIARIIFFCRRITPSSGCIVLVAHGTSSAGLALFASMFLPGSKITYIPHGGISHCYLSDSPFLRTFVYAHDLFLMIFGVRFLCESKYTYSLYLYVYRKYSWFKVTPLGYVYSCTRKQMLSSSTAQHLAFANETDSSSKLDIHLVPFRVAYLGTWRSIKGAIHLANVLESMNSSFARLPSGRPISFEFYTDFRGDLSRFKFDSSIRVSFMPWTNDVSALLSKIDVQIIPSKMESFGYAALEALLSRVPVIHTNVGGLDEITSRTKMPIISTDFSARELYDAISLVSDLSFDGLINTDDPLGHIFGKSYWHCPEVLN